jgi:hypothetical protein
MTEHDLDPSYLQGKEHEVDPGPRVARLHGVQGGLVEAVLAGPALAREVELGVFPVEGSQACHTSAAEDQDWSPARISVAIMYLCR